MFLMVSQYIVKRKMNHFLTQYSCILLAEVPFPRVVEAPCMLTPCHDTAFSAKNRIFAAAAGQCRFVNAPYIRMSQNSLIKCFAGRTLAVILR